MKTENIKHEVVLHRVISGHGYFEPETLIFASKPVYDDEGVLKFEEALRQSMESSSNLIDLAEKLRSTLEMTEHIKTREMLAERLGVFVALTLKYAGITEKRGLAVAARYCAPQLDTEEEVRRTRRINHYSSLFYQGFFAESGIESSDILELNL